MSRAVVDLGDLGLDQGGHLLLKRALRGVAVGDRLIVCGRGESLAVHLRAFCRTEGHDVIGWDPPDGAPPGFVAEIARGGAELGRWRGAERAGHADAGRADAIADRPSRAWGLAARGAAVEAGSPSFDFRLLEKRDVWAVEAKRLYAQAVAAQWDPATAIPWDAEFSLPDEIEDAVVQIMTYLVENETAALIVPARFASEIHPHFREVMQLLAVQAADEARHIEVFTRRALLRRSQPGLSTAGGQLSLKTLVDERDFASASFLLSVLGEGSFLALLWFLYEQAPDPVTREVARLAAQDEARHVAFGMAHLERHLEVEPELRGRLASAISARHQALRHSSGLNEEVFDALVLVAAKSFDPTAIAAGHRAVVALQEDMDDGRRKRLRRLGWDAADAETLSSLHTQNFM
ncbi:MAG: ferritin-like domain-containing protein [Polyangiaceae bacterium]|nr:ferritin-like domain-containing protein [Polyangiaceae bacterium]